MLGRAKKTGRSESDQPPFPDELDYLWAWFEEVIAGLASTGFGPPIVSWESLDAWCRLRQIILEPWESSTLVMLGQLRAGVLTDKKPPPPTPKKRK